MKWKYRISVLLLFCSLFLISTKVYANSGRIQFTTPTSEVQKGDDVTVICQVVSDYPFVDASFSVSYDQRYLTFITGGNKVSGANGVLTVSSVGNTEETNKKTFSLQFEAKKKGIAVIGLEGQAKVTDADGNSFSMSSNHISVTVLKKGSLKDDKAEITPVPQVTPEPVLSKENRLKILRAHCVSFSPAFVPDKKKYKLVVDATTDNLYISYQPMDKKARVLVKGNEGLISGENKVIVSVFAEDGKEQKYQLTVYRETKEETEKRQLEEQKDENDIAFSIKERQGKIFMRNSYEFEVLDPTNLSSVPAGYVQTNIELEGMKVSAFTMENDLANNYLLLYLKGPSGESTLYQYDRKEQTLQRYTGTMTKRINQGQRIENTTSTSISNRILLGIIAILVILLISTLIVMLKMAMQRKRNA